MPWNPVKSRYRTLEVPGLHFSGNAFVRHWRGVPMSGLFGNTLVGSISMPTHIHVKFGFTDKVGNDCLARFTFRQMLFESLCPSLLIMGKTFARFRFRLEH